MFFFTFLKAFNWHDIVDILIISFFIHRFYFFFRGTNVLRIVIGLFFIWLFYLTARSSGLVLTSWFLQGLGATLIILIIVVFQREIREILLHTSPFALLWKGWKKPEILDLEVFSKIIFNLAKRRIGALVVFQQENLSEHLQGCTSIGAIFSPQLLESILIPTSPIHDGAVIISGNRIEKAGCFLPLTERPDLPHKFGSRHRAALGLAERSDVVVVIISEERGEVHILKGRTINQVVDPRELCHALKDMFYPQIKKAKTQIRRNVIKGLISYGFVTILVLIFWGFLGGRQPSLKAITVPLEFRGLPANCKMLDVSTNTVELQIQGRRHLINTLKPEQIGAYLDLDKFTTSGRHFIPLSGLSVNLPPGLEVVQIKPRRVKIKIEKLITKTLGIHVVWASKLPPGTDITIMPQAIEVLGAEPKMKNIKYINTIPVNGSTLSPGQEIEVALALAKAPFKLVAGQPEKVKIIVKSKNDA